MVYLDPDYSKKYQQQNREKIREYQRKYYLKKKERDGIVAHIVKIFDDDGICFCKAYNHHWEEIN